MLKNALAAFALYRAYTIVFPSEVKSVEGKVCLVTGAGGGLCVASALWSKGVATVKELRNRNCGHLILWDVKQAALDQFKGLPNVTCMVVDVSKRENIYQALEQVVKIALPDYVFNIAGVVIASNAFQDAPDVADELTMQVNVMSHIWVTKFLLPRFEARGSGHFVNVSSFASFVATAGMVTYAASKFAARGFCEGLNHELKNRGSKVKVTCVCPSHFETPMFDGFRVLGNVMMTADYVAQRAVQGACAERELVCLPQYLIPMLPVLALWQVNGFLNQALDFSNPMQGKTQTQQDHVKGVFAAMGAKL